MNDPREVTGRRCSVDWVTATAKSGAARRRLGAELLSYKHELEGQGFESRPWRWKGYAGFLTAGVRWGTRDDSDIAMVSGQDAAMLWHAVLPAAENVSRVDLAVTVHLGEPYEGVAEVCYEWVHMPESQVAARHRRYTIIQNTAGGETLYVGSRKSDQMGRLYDKGIEAGDGPAGLIWRYEVEYKRGLAAMVAEKLVGWKGNREETNRAINNTVWTWFDSRAVPPIFDRNGSGWLIEHEARVTSAEKKLRWLSTQVAPSIAWLKRRGYTHEIYEALGLLLEDDGEPG